MVFDSLRKDCIGCYGKPYWGEVKTPNFDALAKESLMMTRAYPESLPTLPTRRALYTGKRTYPFDKGNFWLKGDFYGFPGWGAIPEDQPTLAEMLSEAGYRTALVSDVCHMFKPSKNFTRGFNQWTFLRGNETDSARSGPALTEKEVEAWVHESIRTPRWMTWARDAVMNMKGRVHEEDYCNARVLIEASKWIEENQDAKNFFLTIESFDPHEAWFVPEYYRRMYDNSDSFNQVLSFYEEDCALPEPLRVRTRANYSGLVTMCDRWFGHLMDTLRATGRLDDTLIIFTSDHGHSIFDRNYIGKRPYPSTPEVYDIPILIRHPEGIGAGKKSDMYVQHHDISAVIMEATGVKPVEPMDGIPFYKAALEGGPSIRDHVTVGWGSTPTVIKDNWWLNCKVDGTGVLLRDLSVNDPFAANVADKYPEVVDELFAMALKDADGKIPDWLFDYDWP
jgi:arylsulfatase A-like enzyme